MQHVKERVLLVDDEPQVLIALEDLLADEFVVVKSQSPEAALELVQDDDIAVVVSDQRMPRMNGDEFLARLRGSSDATRIMVTAFADLSAVIRAVNDGRIFAYVTKPWDPNDLRLKVQRAAEHHRMARELAYERQLLHDLMDNIPDGIYFKDGDLRLLRANRVYAQMLRRQDPRELVGKTVQELTETTPAAEVEAAERQLLREVRAEVNVVRCWNFGHGERWVSETKAPVQGVGVEAMGLVGVCRDITNQRHLEQQLQQAQKMEAIGRLAGGVAHDFNNLLSIITATSELLLAEATNDRTRSHDLEAISEAARRAARLTRQLLAISRPPIVQPVPEVDVRELVETMLPILGKAAGSGVVIHVGAEPSLWSVACDPTELERALLNLVINARDAMVGDGTIDLRLSNRILDAAYARQHPEASPGEFVMLSLRDTGMGMSTETTRRIFEPFFTTKAPGKGTGLGLASVYGAVTQHGGHVAVHSELGVGTTFELYFPRSTGTKSAIEESGRDGEASGGAQTTVLVVESDASLRGIISRILTRAGYVVLEAGSPAEARSCTADGTASIDVLLADLSFPHAEAGQLVRELQATHGQLRTIYTSGRSVGAGQIEPSTELPAGFLLEKPFTPAKLLQALTGDREAESR